MDDSKRSRVMWIALALLGLVLSTCLGAFAGGVTGYWLGRRSVQQAESGATLGTPQVIPEETQVPEWPWGDRRMPDLNMDQGATVTSVVSDSPAEKAGIQVGDVITAVDGESVADNDLRDLIGDHDPGDTVQITLLRLDEELTVKVKLGSKPDDSSAAYLGIYYVMATPDTEEPSY